MVVVTVVANSGFWPIWSLPVTSSFLPSLLRILGLLAGLYLLFGVGVFFAQRSLLYHPTHRAVESVMERWVVEGQYLGFCRPVENPTGVWLITHGNGGQAAHRDYLLEQVEATTAVYVLEYPGYGERLGRPTQDSINRAAAEAWRLIQAAHPGIPAGVIGESIGSGPASLLAREANPPDKMVLLVPFDRLYRVAAAQFWWLPVKQLMRDQWDNQAALQGFAGSVEIYAAAEDEVIPKERAQALADAVDSARYVEMPGSHNAWVWDELFVLGPEAPVQD